MITTGVIIISQIGIFSNLTKFKNKIDSPQKVELFPIYNSLNKYPAAIAPIANTINGIIITNGDS